MSNSINLSICIATYNRGKFIGETLDSILSQMQPGVEIVVLDGASPDNTSKIMAQYVSRHSEIHYYREQENSGVDRDYDKAVGYATGEYCWLMTDDDVLLTGAISRVLALVDGTVDLVVVNAQIRTADLSKELRAHFLHFDVDREYDAGNAEKCFSEIAYYLSFIGCVVVKRSIWMDRDRTSFFGTLFVHVGVIFQHPPIEKIKVIGDPLIAIRYGNAMWSARGFEIWMFKWPQLVWSFPGFSDQSKLLVCPKEPWKRFKWMIWYRALGAYSILEYMEFIAKREQSRLRRFIYMGIAMLPANAMNTLATLYCILINRGARSYLYDLSRSKTATWFSRYFANCL